MVSSEVSLVIGLVQIVVFAVLCGCRRLQRRRREEAMQQIVAGLAANTNQNNTRSFFEQKFRTCT